MREDDREPVAVPEPDGDLVVEPDPVAVAEDDVAADCDGDPVDVRLTVDDPVALEERVGDGVDVSVLVAL